MRTFQSFQRYCTILALVVLSLFAWHGSANSEIRHLRFATPTLPGSPISAASQFFVDAIIKRFGVKVVTIGSNQLRPSRYLEALKKDEVDLVVIPSRHLKDVEGQFFWQGSGL